MSCNFAEDLDAVAATEMEADVHTSRKTSTELREKVVHGVRGLMESGDTLPHLTADVAQCYHVVDSDSGQDAEVAQLLTSRNVINWCRTTKPLVPLAVHGPGNCLDVASSVVLWGVDDLATLLRRLIYMSLVEFGISKFYQRWRKQFSVVCHADMFSRSDRDWEQLVKSVRPRHEELEMESAETISLSDNIQVFVLANVLRRPIIVLSNSRDMPQSTTLFERDCIAERAADSTSNLQDVGGIYLPLLWKPEDCIRYPVVLGSIAGRFVPLVGQRGGPAGFQSALDIIPVVTSQLEPLRIWFLLDEEEQEAYTLQQQYLNMTEVNLTRTHSIDMVLGARMRYEQLETGSMSRPTAAAAVVTGPVSLVPSGLNVLLESQQARNLPSMSLPPGDLVSMERLPVAGTNQRHPLRSGNIGELSIVNEHCHAAGCVNCASSFIYPYCYEHIDRRVVESTVARRPIPTAAPEPSLLNVSCQQPGCHNMSSRYVYPFCYEHIESRITGLQQQQQQQHQAAPSHDDEYLASVSPDKCIHPQCINQASMYTYPVCYEHLDFFALSTQMNNSQPATVVQVSAVAPPSQTHVAKYDEMMADIEARTRVAMSKCRQPNCSNYGNSRCQGMCYECYKQLQQQQQHSNFSSTF